MKIEHVAFQVAQPAQVAQWFVEHLGLRMVRSSTESPYMHFLADTGNHVMVELYNNPAASVPDYRSMDPLHLHLAFSVTDVQGERQRLLAAGATAVGEPITTPAGDTLAMLRDPWGLAIQLCQRATPMI